MADWGLSGGTPALDGATAYFNNVTTGAADTYGAWFSLGTPTEPVNGFYLSDDFAGSGGVRGKLVSLGIGPSGSQVTVLADLPMPQPSAETYQSKPKNLYLIPLMLPAGQEIWAKVKCSLATQTCQIRLTPTRVDPALLGAGIDNLFYSAFSIPSAGTYVNGTVISSAAKRYKAIFLVASGAVANSTGVGALTWRIKRGAIGVEQITTVGTQLIQQYNPEPATANPHVGPVFIPPFLVDIPLGERFYFQATSSVGAETFAMGAFGIW